MTFGGFTEEEFGEFLEGFYERDRLSESGGEVDKLPKTYAEYVWRKNNEARD